MGKQKMYESVIEIREYLRCNDICMASHNLDVLINVLNKELQMEENKKIGNNAKAVSKEFNSIVKNAEKEKRDKHAHVFKIDDNTYAAVDGYRLLKYNGKLVVDAVHDEDVNKFINNIMQSTVPSYEGIEVELPSIADLKNFISEQKAKNKLNKTKNEPVWIFENVDNVAINANYLLGMLKVGVTKMYNSYQSFIGKNEDGNIEYLCMGVRR